MVRIVRICFVLMQWSVVALGEDAENITISTLNDTIINGTFSILNETDIADFQNSSILRYGHHRTYDCPDFQKAYVCIMMCLERGFHIARADKKCSCSCFKNKLKAKYFDKVHDWKIPTTTKPAWAAGPSSSTLEVHKLNIIGGEIVHLDSDERPQNLSDALSSDGNGTLENNESTVDPNHDGDENDEHESEEHDDESDDGDAHDGAADDDEEHDEDADDGEEHDEDTEDEAHDDDANNEEEHEEEEHDEEEHEEEEHEGENTEEAKPEDEEK